MCYNDILDGIQFPFGFTRLLEMGNNGKRVRATPNPFCTEITQKWVSVFKFMCFFCCLLSYLFEPYLISGISDG